MQPKVKKSFAKQSIFQVIAEDGAGDLPTTSGPSGSGQGRTPPTEELVPRNSYSEVAIGQPGKAKPRQHVEGSPADVRAKNVEGWEPISSEELTVVSAAAQAVLVVALGGQPGCQL